MYVIYVRMFVCFDANCYGFSTEAANRLARDVTRLSNSFLNCFAFSIWHFWRLSFHWNIVFAAVIQPWLVLRCNGVLALINAVLECHMYGRISECLCMSLMHLINHPSVR